VAVHLFLLPLLVVSTGVLLLRSDWNKHQGQLLRPMPSFVMLLYTTYLHCPTELCSSGDNNHLNFSCSRVPLLQPVANSYFRLFLVTECWKDRWL
jgi:hypothetical protein